MNYGAGYIISRMRRDTRDNVTFDGITDRLQRFSVTMRYRDTTAAAIDDTITRALGALARTPKPIGGP